MKLSITKTLCDGPTLRQNAVGMPGGFLRQIVPDAALDESMRIFPREFLPIGCGIRMDAPMALPSRAIVGTVITGACASRFSKSSCIASPFRETEPPAIIANHDGDAIGIVTGRCPTSELREVVAVLVRVLSAAAVRTPRRT
jgi:hypothetical protein